MVTIALFAAVLCVTSPLSIAVGPIPLSLTTLLIYLAAGSLGWRCGVISVVVYVLLGAAGLPVFSNFEGGFHKIAGLTGGFIIGYIPCALATGWIGGAIQKYSGRAWLYILGMFTGTVLLYTCGTVWFILQTGSAPVYALTVCVVPFLPGDAIKITVAGITAPRLRSAILTLRKTEG